MNLMYRFSYKCLVKIRNELVNAGLEWSLGFDERWLQLQESLSEILHGNLLVLWVGGQMVH